jgi:hypothetical protein
VQKILGHERLATTAIYLNFTDVHIQDEFEPKWWGPQPPSCPANWTEERCFLRGCYRNPKTAKRRKLAAQDVGVEILGGAAVTRTWASGKMAFRRIPFDSEWLRHHALLTFRPDGRRHHAAVTLQDLFGHPEARDFVARISALVPDATDAFARRDAIGLANPMRQCVCQFDARSQGRFLSPDVRQLTDCLGRLLSDRHLVTKPAGAGAASCALVLVADPNALRVAQHLARSEGWVAEPASIAARGLARRRTTRRV